MIIEKENEKTTFKHQILLRQIAIEVSRCLFSSPILLFHGFIPMTHQWSTDNTLSVWLKGLPQKGGYYSVEIIHCYLLVYYGELTQASIGFPPCKHWPDVCKATWRTFIHHQAALEKWSEKNTKQRNKKNHSLYRLSHAGHKVNVEVTFYKGSRELLKGPGHTSEAVLAENSSKSFGKPLALWIRLGCFRGMGGLNPWLKPDLFDNSPFRSQGNHSCHHHPTSKMRF